MNKEIKNYNLVKAITEARQNKLSGLELELHQEAQLRGKLQLPINPALTIPDAVIERFLNRDTNGQTPVSIYNKPFDIVPDYKKWGVTVLDNLTSTVEVPLGTNSNFQKLEVGESVPEIEINPNKGVLKPFRYQGYNYYSNDYLTENNAVELLISNAIQQINREISKDLLQKALINSSTTVTEPTEFIKILGDIDNTQGIINPSFITSDTTYRKYLELERTTGNGFVLVPLENNFGKILGVNTFGTDLIVEDNTESIIFADWSRAYVGLFGGLNMIFDPFSRSNDGYTKLTFSRFADTVINPSTTVSVVKELD